MMNETLHGLIFKRLCDDENLAEGVADLVLAACSGRESLVARLEDQKDKFQKQQKLIPGKGEGSGAFLKSITVEGFRGIGPTSTLELKPGPGITLILGRNGSGKSSFAEGLEFLLTGENKRWTDRRTVTWKEGWRNLHHSGKGLLSAEFAIESMPGGARIGRRWGDSESLDTVEEAVVKRHGQPNGSLHQLGWREDVENFRPFLSYSELGNLLDAPSKMYDAISSVLGLQELVDARELLGEQRRERDAYVKDLKADLKPLLIQLETLEDARAQACLKALSGRKWDLEAVASHLSLEGESSEIELSTLRELSVLKAPEVETVKCVLVELKRCAERRAELTGSQAQRCVHVMELLRKALLLHQVHGDEDCPVCKSSGALSGEWSDAARVEIKTLETQATAARELEEEAKSAVGDARRLVSHPRAFQPCGVELDKLNEAWEVWAQGLSKESPSEMASHFEEAFLPFAAAVEEVRDNAKEELKRREDLWRPMAAELQVWLEKAQGLEEIKATAKLLKTAEKWMKDTEAQIRTDRFAPICEAARENWEMLRHDSNVELSNVSLKGTGKKRSVSLEVTVDGTEGVALGVMSQGELNSLTLSLFLPRATLEESPFRFVIIDDPVQAMDPAKVDGLARVLEKAATNRQVVVFTHDDRLFNAVRRLGIAVTALEVTRRSGSVVALKETLGPTSRALSDAMAVARTKEVGPVVAGKVVPGFCRAAVEAAMTEIIRCRKLEKGCSYQEVEEALEKSSLKRLAALFFWDDPNRVRDVSDRMRRLGRGHCDTFNQLNRGAHGHFQGDAVELVRDTQRMIRDLIK